MVLIKKFSVQPTAKDKERTVLTIRTSLLIRNHLVGYLQIAIRDQTQSKKSLRVYRESLVAEGLTMLPRTLDKWVVFHSPI